MTEVSVIVPTYNRADLIEPALRSILGQSHKPAEVIVVDDGSRDNTAAVVRQFGPAVKYLSIENSGECRARNVGVEASSAPWVAFCDSDDLWHPDKLRLQVRLFERAPNAEYGFTNFQTVVEDHWSATTKFDTSPAGYWNLPHLQVEPGLFVIEVSMFERLLRHQPIFPSTLMMKRSFFEAAGRWREPLGRTPSVDMEFHLRCVSHPPIAVVATPVVGIRKHSGNFSGDKLRTLVGEVEILRYVLANNPVAADYKDAIHEQIILRSGEAAEAAFAAGQLKRTNELLKSVPHGRRSWKQTLKALIAAVPGGMGQSLQRATVALTRPHSALRAPRSSQPVRGA